MRKMYKLLGLAVVLAIAVTLTWNFTASASGHNHCTIPANQICVVVDGQQETLQQYVDQLQQGGKDLKNNLDGLVCRVDYLGTGMGGFLGGAIGELRGAFQKFYPDYQFNWTPFPTPPNASTLADWCAQYGSLGK